MVDEQTDNVEDFEDLYVDKDLLSVFLKAPSVFATCANAIMTIVAFALLTGFCTVRYLRQDQVAAPSFTTTFAAWATIGWTVSSTLLGFLVAGFALLCTVLRPKAVIALHRWTDDNGKNRLRNLFLFFVDIFVGFLLMLAFSLGMVLMTSPDGPIKELKAGLLVFGREAPLLVGYATYVLWGTWSVVLLLKTKSFVYNIYQTLLIAMTQPTYEK